MARIARLVVPDFPHHVVQRGVHRVEALVEVFGMVPDEESRPLCRGAAREQVAWQKGKKRSRRARKGAEGQEKEQEIII